MNKILTFPFILILLHAKVEYDIVQLLSAQYKIITASLDITDDS